MKNKNKIKTKLNKLIEADNKLGGNHRGREVKGEQHR